MTSASTRGRLRGRLLWTAAVAALALLFAKSFVGDVYRVTSTSMEPTLYGAEGRQERVLVVYDRSPPRRWELVVIRRPGEPDALVKRVVGIAGERVQVVGGDVLIDGRRAPRAADGPGPFPLRDARHGDLASWLGRDDVHGGWSLADGVLTLDATPHTRAATFLLPEVDDGYLDPEGRLVSGGEEVNDLVVEATCELEPGAWLALGLTEQGDLFRLVLERGRDEPTLRVALERVAAERPHAPGVELAATQLAWNGARRVRFANVDDELTADVDGRRILTQAYDGNRFDPSDPLFEGRHYRARLFVTAERAAARVRDLCLARDVYYTARGAQGTREPVPLGPDRMFVLGDNSAHSRDSREWGPVPTAELVGRPRWVVWPPSRWRRLGGRAGSGGAD